jgi:hypothetical protein
MYISDMVASTRGDSMTAVIKRTLKHVQLDSAKIKRVQKALHAKTETEAIERALDFAIAVREKNRLVLFIDIARWAFPFLGCVRPAAESSPQEQCP